MKNKLKVLSNLQQAAKEVGHIGISDRIDSIVQFMNDYNIPIERDNKEPLYIVWSVSTRNETMLRYQIKQVLQNAYFISSDYIHFVCDSGLKSLITIILNEVDINCQVIVTEVDRGSVGDSPILNWEVGLVRDVPIDRTLFIRDGVLFFDIINLIEEARKVNIENSLVNFSTILGSHIAPLATDWVWAVHSKYAPAPVLSSWVVSQNKLKGVGGFDIKFRRGNGYLGDIDLLLRWVIAGGDYVINDSVTVLKLPLMVRDEDEKNRMNRLTARLVPFFRDKYSDVEDKLKPPFKLDLTLMKVTDAMTYDPISRINWGNYKEEVPVLKNLFEFYKLDLTRFIK